MTGTVARRISNLCFPLPKRLWWRVQASAVTGSNRLPKLYPADGTAFSALRAGGERAGSTVRCPVCRQRPDQQRRRKAQANGQPLQRMFHDGAVTGHRRNDDAQSALRQSRGLSDGSRESAIIKPINNQPSSAMLKGFTSQLMPTVTPIPRHCSATRCNAPKSTLSNIGTIISQISTATGMLTWATVIRPSA
jgi:hypothetical protein